ncbi:hypothetical protein OG439_46295 [Amycolatopsis sp. NBC_01307]|uniref:hypothetical protein n=1 Tax=Amycolatopsis sp. NBC_01307 TaxID=2903561 RepID=UPI002E0DE4E2|nr:hypothetical protein OG439_46295 [Amycolatopsis sp. NBC_01307]
MIGWGIFSLVVVAVPLVAVAVWVYGEQRSSRQRRKFLQRYKQRSVAGIRSRVEQELATEDTQVMPKIPREPLAPDPLQDGHISGYLPLPKRVRGYGRKPTPYPRMPAPPPEDELMRRILDGLKRL